MTKGIVSMIEMVITAVVLLTAFNIIFPGNLYKTNWGRSQLLLNSRDVISTLDHLGKLYYYSYSPSDLNYLIGSILGNSTISWVETNGLIKSKINIACNCTNDQISTLNSWLYGITINGRTVQYSVCYTNLDKINPCSSQTPDVLIIWQNKTISSNNIVNTLTNYVSLDNGIVEVADFTPSFDFSSDIMQSSIFGMTNCTYAGISGCNYNLTQTNDTIGTPTNATDKYYAPWKYFYHAPLTVNSFINASASGLTSVPVEGGTSSCSSSSIFNGTFSFYQTSYLYWICSSRVYFDTDSNKLADKVVAQQTSFSINGTNLYMKYINVSSFQVSFKPVYNFKDFLSAGNTKVYPTDKDTTRIFSYFGNYSGTNNPAPVIMLNTTSGSRIAWIADFTRNGLASVGDDQKIMFISLLFWASNKHNIPSTLSNIAFGYTTSFVNTVNDDIFEPYTFTLGLGQPY